MKTNSKTNIYQATKQTLINVTKFAIFSGSGLIIDLSLFYFLTKTNLPIVIINTISSYSAVTFVYFMSSKFLFKKNGTLLRYIIYLIYISLSILGFSLLINQLVIKFKFNPNLAKIITVPISFICNYIFTKIIITTTIKKIT